MSTDCIAHAAIESLRSGVPSRRVVEQLGTTQARVQAAFDDRLEQAGRGEPVVPLLFTASFGLGKSHLLEYLKSQALARGFVASYVVVSPEMPLGNAHVVLKAIAENAEVRGHTGVALRSLSTTARTSTEPFARLRLWARDAGISDRFAATMLLYEEFSADPEFRMQIVADVEGKPMGKTLLRQKLREIKQLDGFDLRHPRNALLAHDRIRLYAQFAVACGARGLVVFFDELERLSKFSRRQRMAAYSELGWWNKTAAEAGACIVPVFAGNPVHVQEAVQMDLPHVQAPPRPIMANEPDELMRAGIALLRDESIPLQSITAEERAQLKAKVRDLYRRAYSTNPPDPPEADVSRTVRSDIRRWITFWDLHRFYPEYRQETTETDIPTDDKVIDDRVIPANDGEDE